MRKPSRYLAPVERFLEYALITLGAAQENRNLVKCYARLNELSNFSNDFDALQAFTGGREHFESLVPRPSGCSFEGERVSLSIFETSFFGFYDRSRPEV